MTEWETYRPIYVALAVIGLCLLFFYLGAAKGSAWMERESEYRAIEAGHGEWYDGFRWKECDACKTEK